MYQLLDLLAEPEDWVVNKADEYLNYQHDQQIKQFYKDAKQQKGPRERM